MAPIVKGYQTIILLAATPELLATAISTFYATALPFTIVSEQTILLSDDSFFHRVTYKSN